MAKATLFRSAITPDLSQIFLESWERRPLGLWVVHQAKAQAWPSQEPLIIELANTCEGSVASAVYFQILTKPQAETFMIKNNNKGWKKKIPAKLDPAGMSVACSTVLLSRQCGQSREGARKKDRGIDFYIYRLKTGATEGSLSDATEDAPLGPRRTTLLPK